MANDPWRGKWALVTGASSGIGAALAEELAAGGAHLVLTARRARRLAGLRRKLHVAHGVRIEVLPADLAQPNTPTQIFAFTQERGIAIDLLVNNAGIGSYGAFRASDRERELGIIQLNCAALVHLTHLYLPSMLERGSGDILIVSSTAAYQSVPYMAIRAFHDWNGAQHCGVAGMTCLGRDAGRERNSLPDTPTGSGRMGCA